MALDKHADLLTRISELGDRVVNGSDIEIVEVQLKGGGKARLLRVYIDKPEGVTHGDCEFVSEKLGQMLDADDVIPGDSYTLEVSSPGVDRPLTKVRDYQRVVGKKIKLALRQPIGGQARLEGKLSELNDGILAMEISPGQTLHIPLEQVQKANLKFEW